MAVEMTQRYDQWIIGLLVAALGSILWWTLLDTRETLRIVQERINLNSSRITALERDTINMKVTEEEIKEQMHEHRRVTEPDHR